MLEKNNILRFLTDSCTAYPNLGASDDKGEVKGKQD